MQTVIGLFDTASEAQQAVEQLKNNGFTSDNIDLSVGDNDNVSGSSLSGTTSGRASTGNNYNDDLSDNSLSGTTSGSANTGNSYNDNLSDSSLSGSTSGRANTGNSYNDNLSDSSLSGNASGNTNTGDSYTNYKSTDNSFANSNSLNTSNETFQGNASGSSTSGASDNITTGPDASVTGNKEGFGDKVSSFFKNLFGDNNDEANRYTHVASKARNIVTVHAQTEDEAEEAADILDECGAVDVNERASEYGYSSNYSGGNYSSDESEGDNDETLKVIKEDVQVGKREVETGGVRLKSRIVERPVEEQLRLREERVTVQRTPVDRIATDADLQNFKEGEIEMTEHAEIANVSKQSRVVEEVKLSKEVNERVQTVHETARDTEVDIENLEKGKTSKKTKGKSL